MKLGDRVKVKIEKNYLPAYVEGTLENVYITPKTNLWDVRLDDGSMIRGIDQENIEVLENGENNED